MALLIQLILCSLQGLDSLLLAFSSVLFVSSVVNISSEKEKKLVTNKSLTL